MLFIIIVVAIIIYAVWYNQVQIRKFREIYNNAQALKKTAHGKGSFFHSPYRSRRDFLDYMGQFFKYKKHEWIFVAFMVDGLVDRFWLNKGPSAEGVSPFIGIQDIARICKDNGYTHVLVGHNHPAGALSPSKQDRIFLEEFMDLLAQENISVEHLVFVAGRWRNYGLSVGQHLYRLFTGRRRTLK